MIFLKQKTLSFEQAHYDPVAMMEVSLIRRKPFSPDLQIHDEILDSKKRWVGKVDKKRGSFSVKAITNGSWGSHASVVKVIGIVEQEGAKQITIRLVSSSMFMLSSLLVALVLYFFVAEMTNAIYGVMVVLLSVAVNGLRLYNDLKKTEQQLEMFINELEYTQQ
ncbi:hypothetical protein [Fulvivirga sediminis]|uniref:Uncharacterized protein n=1 Tax=Fulvivirga sediminis TaxID=2803949 RepID=A0A937F9C3_9BACT|nr:hypothetical protein [Fulvivirga sediminis]MBL3657397.1 hypothetical protein [Fulvivirga sediminis]